MRTHGTVVVQRLLGICSICLVTATVVLLPGCNTIKGIGKDITGAAESTEQAFSDWSEPNDSAYYQRRPPSRRP